MNRERLRELARLTHECWREEMTRQGWRYGPEYDPDAGTHDALVPFEKLARWDQRATELRLDCESMIERLSGLVRYPRGPDRPLTLEEMRVGLCVLPNTDKPDRPTGSVVEWTLDEEGELEWITVQWSDGDRTRHFPGEQELTRAAESEALG